MFVQVFSYLFSTVVKDSKWEINYINNVNQHWGWVMTDGKKMHFKMSVTADQQTQKKIFTLEHRRWANTGSWWKKCK